MKNVHKDLRFHFGSYVRTITDPLGNLERELGIPKATTAAWLTCLPSNKELDFWRLACFLRFHNFLSAEFVGCHKSTHDLIMLATYHPRIFETALKTLSTTKEECVELFSSGKTLPQRIQGSMQLFITQAREEDVVKRVVEILQQAFQPVGELLSSLNGQTGPVCDLFAQRYPELKVTLAPLFK